MQAARYERLFQKAFYAHDLYVRAPAQGELDAHGKPIDDWGAEYYLCRCDRQTLQGEETPSHRSGGSRKARLYIAADQDLPTGSLVRFDDETEQWRVVGIPRTQSEAQGWMQVTLVDIERWEG